MKHTLALLGAVLVLVLLAALRHADAPRAARAPRQNRPLPGAPCLPCAQESLRAEGARHAYDFSIDQQIAVATWKPASLEGGRGIDVPELAMRSKLTGQLLARVISADTVGFEVADVEHEGVEGADASELMRGEVIVLTDAKGRVRGVRFPEEMDPRGRLLWRRLLLAWPGRPEAGTREEEDPTGVAVVTCEQESENVFVRRKTAYREVRMSGRRFEGEVRVSGETRIEMDGLPLRVEGEETVALWPSDGPAMRSTARFSLVRTGSERFEGPPSTKGAFEPLLTATAALAPAPEPAVARERARKAVAELRVLDDRTSLEHHEAMSDLLRALSESDEAIAEIMGLLRSGAADPDLSQRLVVTIAATGTDAAQAALVEILGGAGHLAPLQESAVVASLQVERPRPEIDGALAAILAASGDEYALCALAAVGDRVRDAPERFRAIERTVLEKLKEARGPAQLRVALEALGNLGPDDLPLAVKQASANEDPEVRRAAARSLLRVRDPQADLLLARLLGDEEARVRAAALDTLVRRDRAGLLNNEPLPAPLPDLLAGMAQNDPDKGLREFACALAGNP